MLFFTKNRKIIWQNFADFLVNFKQIFSGFFQNAATFRSLPEEPRIGAHSGGRCMRPDVPFLAHAAALGLAGRSAPRLGARGPVLLERRLEVPGDARDERVAVEGLHEKVRGALPQRVRNHVALVLRAHHNHL